MARRFPQLSILLIFIILLLPVRTTSAEDIEIFPPEKGDRETDAGFPDVTSLKEYKAQSGLRNLEPHSVYLINRGIRTYAGNSEDEAIAFFHDAVALSPDLPIPYLYLAKAYFSFSGQGLSLAVRYLFLGLKALYKNFWWSFQTAGVFILSLLLSLYIASLVLFLMLISSKVRLFVHDVGENRRNALYVLPAFVLAFVGPVFGVVGLLLPFWKYMKKRERVFLYTAVVALIVIVLTLPLSSTLLGASKDSTLRGVIKVNEGVYTNAYEERREDGDDYETLFSEALFLKRRGYLDEAIEIYERLLGRGDDARIYNNLANCFVGLGDYDQAFTYYEEALRSGKGVTPYYNMSQLYREIFNFSQAEVYFKKATAADPEKVSFYNSVRGDTFNSFVMDELLSRKELTGLAFRRYRSYGTLHSLGRLFTFTDWRFSAALLGLLILSLYVYGRRESYGAYSCRRCGSIFCGKCEKRISREEVCLACFKTLVKTSEIGPKERIERILEIQRYRDDRNQRFKLLTVVFPGSGHLYYGWSLYGVLLVLIFSFFLSLAVLSFSFPVPELMNRITALFGWIAAASLVLVYGFAVLKVFRRVPRKWH